jgi:hypothetical protein
MLAPSRLPLLLQRGFHLFTSCRLLPPWPALPPPFPTLQAAQKAPVSAPQAHIHPLFLNSRAITKQRVGDTDGAAPFPSFFEGTAAFPSAFPDIPELQDADSGQRRALLDTGQRCHLANSSTSCVHISRPQHSAVGNTDNPGAAEAAIPSALDDSADNPSAAASTACLSTDERDDERSARGDSDAGRWFGSEAQARVPSSQLGGEPSACGA